MLQRILGGVLVLLGLVAVALGVASATVWRDADTVVAKAEPAGDGTMVVTDPGVLGLVGDDVTVSATVPEGQKVTLAVGRDVDVLGWVGDDPYSRVTGLEDWQTLSTEQGASAADADSKDADAKDADAAKAPTTGPDPAGSDMWVAQASDTDSATLRWSDRPGRWTLLAAGVGDGAEAPTVQLTWSRTVTTPYLWPAVGVGAVLVLGGILLLVLGGRRRRRADGGRSARSHDVGPGGAAVTSADDEPARGADDDGGAGLADRSGSPFSPVSVRAAGTGSTGSGASTDTSVVPVPDTASGVAPEVGPGASPEATSGTAEVPVTGRLLRRSRRRSAALADEQSPASAGGEEPTDGAPSVAHEPVPAASDAPQAAVPQPALPQPAVPQPATPRPAPAEHGSDDQPEPSVLDDDRPVTGSFPRMTRRELRAQEEARRAAEQGGVTRMFRAMTGQTPVVRPQATQGGADERSSADLSTPAGRAAAWRATWGFGQGSGKGAGGSGNGDAENTDVRDDGENR